MTPVDWRESLTLSRNARLPFPVAWEIATTEHPLEDFMEGYFNEGRDSEGKDFAEWLRSVWEGAYDSKAFSRGQKPTRLEPRNTYAEGLSEAYNGSQGQARANLDSTLKEPPAQDGPEDSGGWRSRSEEHADTLNGGSAQYARRDARRNDLRIAQPAPIAKRCKSGDRCDRVGGHGLTGLFCEHHAGELGRIRKVHGLDEAFDWDEFSSKTYQAAFG